MAPGNGGQLTTALAAEAAARDSVDTAADALRKREADLKNAEAAVQAAASAMQKAASELTARESDLQTTREATLRLAHTELASGKGGHGDGHGHGGHGHHDHDDDFHGAKHQLEHRWVEKTAFGIAERVVHRMAEGVGERIAERGAEAAIEKASEAAIMHITGRVIGESLRMGEHAAMQALKALAVIVPFVGMFFVFHLAEHDYHRLTEEWGKRRVVTSGLFLLAVAGDIIDILAHAFVVSAGLVHMDHHFLHTIEHYGMAAGVVACLATMAGEIASVKQSKRETTKKASVHIVPVTGSNAA